MPGIYTTIGYQHASWVDRDKQVGGKVQAIGGKENISYENRHIMHTVVPLL